MSEVKQHAKLSASGSSQWLNCPGSVKAQESYPNTSNKYAIEGTCAHELADLCLKNEVDAEDYIGKELEAEGTKFTVHKEMVDNVQQYLDYVRAFESEFTTLYTEQTVDFSHIVPNGFGTSDAFIFDSGDNTCHVFDYKHGKGVIVPAENNTQGLMYCLGILNEYEMLEEIDQFVIHIVQPRTFPPNFSHYKISKDDLLVFAKHAKKMAKIALSEDAPRVPGDKQCQWCRAKEDCVARTEIITNTLKEAFDDFDDFSDLENCDSKTLNNAQRLVLLKNQDHIESILKDNRSAVQRKLENGEKFPGYKLVRGKSNRKWTEKAERYLIRKLGKKKAFIQKLIGITEAKKFLSEKEINKVTEKPLGSITMVKESDKRKAIEVEPIEDQLTDLSGFDDDMEDL